ncbi:PEGA domain-containing protein [Candidatus Poribacteria bacterium]
MMDIRMISHRFIIFMLISLFSLLLEANAEDDTGYLGITSQPRRAMIYVDGEYVNASTPTAQLLGLRAGIYRLELAKQGHKLYQEKIVIAAGKILEIDAILAEVGSEEISRTANTRYMEVYITITSNPTGADVYLDDQPIGKTPTRDLGIQASAEEQGDRKLRVVKSGYEPYEETLSWAIIRDRVKIHISAELKAEEKAIKPSPPLEPGKPKKFTMNTQVIIYSIILVVLIAIVVARLIISRRQRTGTD